MVFFNLESIYLGTKLKDLSTDNSLKFLKEHFYEFCKNQGIKRHRTIPNTPQQNGE
jgi:transposase InsO family protein